MRKCKKNMRGKNAIIRKPVKTGSPADVVTIRELNNHDIKTAHDMEKRFKKGDNILQKLEKTSMNYSLPVWSLQPITVFVLLRN